ncbi:MAG: threonine ammonia-lyase IlvA [Bacteroidales bacterium]|nr:threonine ammonia-lyase IlvA [Bacteroidales bacterium]MDT8431301.1 threonine ammonia-lyase IlvA [Bacteroidales bacterium]
MSDHYIPQVKDIQEANTRLNNVVEHTPLTLNLNLSERYGAAVYLKREDLQIVRSYKIRGAYNKISSLEKSSLVNGVICASAGNHAQGVAYSCQLLGIRGVIVMPSITPKQKIRQVEMFGKNQVEIILHGDTYDDAHAEALSISRESHATFIHPFDDKKVIEGQGTVGLEILHMAGKPLDFLFIPIGGGGLAAGVAAVFRTLSPQTKLVGVEPEGAPAMQRSIASGGIVTLKEIDKFVDGAAVQTVGELTFPVCRKLLDDVVTVPEGKVCTTILKLYNEEAIVAEPAGALAISALDFYSDQICGREVVCIVSGSNNDITRTEEIKERSLLYEGVKHYFIVRFAQRAGALREFVGSVLGPHDDITHFEYSKKSSRERGPAVIGIELKSPDDFKPLLERMDNSGIVYEYLNEREDLFQFLV